VKSDSLSRDPQPGPQGKPAKTIPLSASRAQTAFLKRGIGPLQQRALLARSRQLRLRLLAQIQRTLALLDGPGSLEDRQRQE
jgi:hypothetical protein